ncbi:MAG: YhgE/Pip domain-containing protein [Clostridium celatum]|nr:YhgE/Pip domain-containing protein [Clostridium celatum]MDU2123136.1 YhgE/Pip domain-containing protein [Clostridium celatum]MDU4979629.1 YhgE/Pip domain-containing protein [Clostridium celatum]
MKGAFEIFKKDLKNIFTNYGALIVVVALCVLPSLYAWFNIKASWDPYAESATSGIKVGVVNKDLGATLNGEEINIGNTVVDELKDNKQMGWQFVSEEEANQMVEEGKYYAMITIPENFSENLTSITTDDIEKGEIIYTVNEKINAIAPKLTDKGATAIQEKISKAIVNTVSDTIFGLANEVGIELENQIPKITTIYNALLDVQDHFGDINDTVNLAGQGAEQLKTLVAGIQEDIPMIKETVENAQKLSGEVKEFLSTSKASLNNIAPVIKNDIKIINEISNDVSKYTSAVIDAINSGSESAPAMIDSLLDKLNIIKKSADSLTNIFETINKFSPGKFDNIISKLQTVSSKTESAITALNTVKDSIASGEQPNLSLLNNLMELSNDISNITNNLYNNFDSEILGKINTIFDDAYTVADNAMSILSEAEEKLPQVSELLTTVYQGADKGIEGIAFVKDKLPEAENMINELISKVEGIKESTDLQDIVNLLKSDVQNRSDFLANPVEIVTNTLFSMGNYGTGMTPFYTVLSLWVGLLLLSSILTVEAHGDYSATAQYFGKLLLFLTISIVQALIVAIGDLYVLKIYCVNPLLFVLGSVFTSIIFTFIVYSLCSVFGNVGKVLGIVLLVIQIGGSGGTFPIQLTPKFFQVINPFLPFTYAISFAREAIGGVVQSVLIKDIIVLSVYAVIFMLVSVFLKKPINKLSQGFTESIKKSGIGE